jgi:alpha-1,2-glucosyltransferase
MPMDKRCWLFVILLLAAIFTWLSVAFSKSNARFDEKTHFRQVKLFMQDKYAMTSSLTTIPGYHLTVAEIAKFFIQPKHVAPEQLRLISLGMALLSIGIFYLLAKKIRPGDPLIRTLQFIFLPLTFFYFPLLYTDIFSLIWILAALYFALDKKYYWSALFSLAAVLVRQTDIVWVAFFWIYTYVSENGFYFSWKKFFDHSRRTAGYVAVAILFLFFVWLNKGVAMGDRQAQQVGFHLGNVYFFLAFLGFLFLPLSLAYFKKDNRLVFQKKLFWGAAIGGAFALVFLFFPPAVHQYNLKMQFLRNVILLFAYYQYALVYALTIFLGGVTLTFMDFEKKDWLIFPFAAAGLIPSLLVEQRYMIVPVVFILLFRKPWKEKAELAILVYFILLSAGLVFMLLRLGMFF